MNLLFQRNRVRQGSVRQSRRSRSLGDHVFTTAQRREWTGSREKLCPENPSPRSILASVSLFLLNLPKVFKYLSLWGTFLIQTIMFCKAKNLTANISFFWDIFVISEGSDLLEINKFSYFLETHLYYHQLWRTFPWM